MMKRTVFTLILAAFSTPTGIAATVYVNSNAAGDTHDGKSWQTAFTAIQPALDAAKPGDEIWVAGGAYTGGVQIANPGIGLYGGFAGTEADRNAAEPRPRPTVIDAGKLGRAVTILSGATDVTLDGFTIRNGYLTRSSDYGAAQGGGVYCAGDRVTLTRNVIEGNTVESTGDEGFGLAVGGGIYAGGVTATVANNVIQGNRAVTSVFEWHPVFVTALIAEGGGVALENARVNVANNLIAGNDTTAGLYGTPYPFGAGLYCSGCTGLITNNTVVGNTHRPEPGSPVPGGIGGSVYLHRSLNTLKVANNIIALNQAGLERVEDAATYSHNDVFGNGADFGPEGSPPGTTITVDPLFASPGAGDFHLQILSPCVDAGDASAVWGDTDLAGLPRVLNYKVDLGAYESAYFKSYTVGDAASALRVAAGLNVPSPSLFDRLNVEPDGRANLVDAVRLIRKALGMDANP